MTLNSLPICAAADEVRPAPGHSVLSFQLNCSDLRVQLGRLSGQLERIPEGRTQDALHLCRGYFERLGLDVVVRQLPGARGANGSGQAPLDVSLGCDFEALVAALRALEVEI